MLAVLRIQWRPSDVSKKSVETFIQYLSGKMASHVSQPNAPWQKNYPERAGVLLGVT